MKKLFVFLIFVVIVILATSCNSHVQQPNQKISVRMDTTLKYPVPITSPLYSCETGKRRPYDKLLAVDSIPVTISLTKDTTISGKNLTPVPPAKPGKKSGAGFNLDWLWPILGFLLGGIAFIIFLMLLAALLYVVATWFFRLLRVGPTALIRNRENVNHHEQQNQQPPATNFNQPNQNQTRGDIFNHQLSMAETLVGRQRIHRITQRADGAADGSWQSEIVIETKNDPPTGQPKE